MRRVSVNKFNKSILVNIREYYEKDGQVLPGKKVTVVCILCGLCRLR